MGTRCNFSLLLHLVLELTLPVHIIACVSGMQSAGSCHFQQQQHISQAEPTRVTSALLVCRFLYRMESLQSIWGTQT